MAQGAARDRGRRRPLCTLALGVLVATFVAPFGRARAADADPATAEALFAAGRDALEHGDYETACAKLSESQRLDPAAGTLMNLAACNEKRGRLASAWENWRDALGTLRSDDERRQVVEERLSALEARLPRLVIVLGAGAPPATVIARDEQLLGPAALGVPLPVDPGAHRISARADGFEERAYSVNAEEGKTTNITVAPGERVVAPPPASVPAAQKKAPPPAVAVSHGSTLRMIGLAVGGVGAAALVTGGVTGALALGRKADIEDHCTKAGDKYLCDPEHVDAARSGKTFAVVSSLTLPAGLILAGVGATLFLTVGDDAPSVSAAAGPGSFLLTTQGAF